MSRSNLFWLEFHVAELKFSQNLQVKWNSIDSVEYLYIECLRRKKKCTCLNFAGLASTSLNTVCMNISSLIIAYKLISKKCICKSAKSMRSKKTGTDDTECRLLTYCWQGKERDAQEGKPCRQHASCPCLWCFVPVADGCQGDLWRQSMRPCNNITPFYWPH